MTEYIKKEDAIEALMGYFTPPIHTGRQVHQAKRIAESIISGTPTIEIVHCKDCKHESIDSGWVCVNPESEYCTDWTEYNDWCIDWECKE